MVQKGELISFWCIGDILELAKEASSIIESELSVSPSIVNARFAKPLDEERLLQHANNHDLIITVEDNVLKGGFGSSVLETLAEHNVPQKFSELAGLTTSLNTDLRSKNYD